MYSLCLGYFDLLVFAIIQSKMSLYFMRISGESFCQPNFLFVRNGFYTLKLIGAQLYGPWAELFAFVKCAVSLNGRARLT